MINTIEELKFKKNFNLFPIYGHHSVIDITFPDTFVLWDDIFFSLYFCVNDIIFECCWFRTAVSPARLQVGGVFMNAAGCSAQIICHAAVLVCFTWEKLSTGWLVQLLTRTWDWAKSNSASFPRIPVFSYTSFVRNSWNNFKLKCYQYLFQKQIEIKILVMCYTQWLIFSLDPVSWTPVWAIVNKALSNRCTRSV